MKTRLLFALLFVGSWPLFAAEENHTGFRVIEEKTENGVTLKMESDYCSEFTVTLEAELQNMTSSTPVPFTADAAGRTSIVLARFKVTDETNPWRYQYRYYWE